MMFTPTVATLASAVMVGLSLSPDSAQAEVVGVRIDRRIDVLAGRLFGSAGQYELLEGRVRFAFDPANPNNRRIVDLGLAPRNGAGRVEAESDIMVLQAKDPARRRGVAIVEVSNRGRKGAFQYFNLADERAADPRTPADFGDGFLMDEGLTIVLLGWQFDVQGTKPLGMRVPVVASPAGPITGLVRSDWTMDRPAREVMLGHFGHWNYPPMDSRDPANQLTVRRSREGARTAIARTEWEFAKSSGSNEFDTLRLNGGFAAGRIYELVYRAKDPRLVGLGLLAIRDIISYAKFDAKAEFPVRKGVAFGFSQTGRFLRHFLYEGLNTDERDRQAYDGMLIQVAGAGRGSFNHRFAQPSRDATPYLSLFFPTDLFPFTTRVQRDPLTGKEDRLVGHQRPEHMPFLFQVNTSYEYWGRAASLIHTTVDGLADVAPLPDERIYLMSGAQHMIEWLTPDEKRRLAGTPAYRGNEVDFRLNYGPDFESKGIISKEPPDIGESFPVLVPQVDGLGNDLAGIRPYELRVPLATNVAWNLRDAPWNSGEHATTGENALTSYLGTFVPLPRTDAERRASGDSRPSIAALYPGKDAYMAAVRQAAADLVSEGFLLARDVALVEQRAAAHWEWAMRR